MEKKELKVNGVPKTVIASPEASLADVLREQLGVTGVKVGCGTAHCGCCSVIMDGKLTKACVTKMSRVEDGASVTTVEGIGTPDNLHPIQTALVAHGAAQCGFCMPGFVVSAKALLDQNASAYPGDVRDWFNKYRNACRCNGYKPVVDAVMDAAKVLRGEMKKEDLEFKMAAGAPIWGSKYPRPSAIAKVTGTLDYGADLGLKLPAGHCAWPWCRPRSPMPISWASIPPKRRRCPAWLRVVTHKDVKGKNAHHRPDHFPHQQG